MPPGYRAIERLLLELTSPSVLEVMKEEKKHGQITTFLRLSQLWGFPLQRKRFAEELEYRYWCILDNPRNGEDPFLRNWQDDLYERIQTLFDLWDFGDETLYDVASCACPNPLFCIHHVSSSHALSLMEERRWDAREQVSLGLLGGRSSKKRKTSSTKPSALRSV